MPKRNAKGHFIKGHTRSHSKRRKSGGAMTHVARPSVTVIRTSSAPRHHAKKRHHRRKSGGGGMNLTHLAIAGAGIAFLAGPASPIKAIPENIAKLPGAKTFGNVAIGGLACLGIDRFVKKNRWLRAAGVVGVVLGAVQLGTQGTNFKWLGDAEADDDGYLGDVSEQ